MAFLASSSIFQCSSSSSSSVCLQSTWWKETDSDDLQISDVVMISENYNRPAGIIFNNLRKCVEDITANDVFNKNIHMDSLFLTIKKFVVNLCLALRVNFIFIIIIL